MTKPKKTIEFRFERLIPAAEGRVFDAWLSPKVPGTTWNAAEALVLEPKLNGLFYWHLKGTSHYGRFTEFERPSRLQHTWMSPNILGEETLVTVTFQKKGKDTLMTLVHSGLPDHKWARGHENGWNYFLGLFCDQYGDGAHKKFSWEDAKAKPKK